MKVLVLKNNGKRAGVILNPHNVVIEAWGNDRLAVRIVKDYAKYPCDNIDIIEHDEINWEKMEMKK